MGKKVKREREAIENEDDLKPTKRTKKSEEAPLTKLTSLLKDKNSLVAGLTYFLQKVEYAEEEVELIRGYLGQFPECQHFLSPLEWDRDDRTYDVLYVCFQSLEQILLFTAAPSIATPISEEGGVFATPISSLTMKQCHDIGHRLVQRLITSHLKCFYHCLMTTIPMKLVGACLRLLTAMVIQGAESAREMQLVFNFSYKPLSSLVNKTAPISSLRGSETVRECFYKFALSFLVIGEVDIITSVLGLKGFLSSFFKLLPRDPPKVAFLFLTTLFDKVVSNPGVSKKTKSSFFNQFSLKQMASLLFNQDSGASTGQEEEEFTEHVQTVAHQILHTLCMDLQLGICYKPKDPPLGLEKTNNPVLLHFLLSLSGRLRDPVTQDLILGTLSVCPDLLISYLTSLGLNFDPQPTSDWVVTISFLIEIYKKLPSLLEILSGNSESGMNAVQPPVEVVGVAVKLSAPPPVTRSHLSLGLQHPLPLVKYYTLRLISVTLRRATGVVEAWGPIRKSLKSISSFLVSYCDAVLKCLPDVKTLISLRQQLLKDSKKACATSQPPSVRKQDKLSVEDALKNESLSKGSRLLSLTLEVLGGYQLLSPSIFSCANFSPAKLIPPFPPPLDLFSTGCPQSHDVSCDQSCDSASLSEGDFQTPGSQSCDSVSSLTGGDHTPLKSHDQLNCVRLALRININAYEETLNRNCEALSTILWLSQLRKKCPDVSELAHLLLHKVISSGWKDPISTAASANALVTSLESVWVEAPKQDQNEEVEERVAEIAKRVSGALVNKRSLRKEVFGIVSGQPKQSSQPLQEKTSKGLKKSQPRVNGKKKKPSWRDSPDVELNADCSLAEFCKTRGVDCGWLTLAHSILGLATKNEDPLDLFVSRFVTSLLLLSDPYSAQHLITLVIHHLPSRLDLFFGDSIPCEEFSDPIAKLRLENPEFTLRQVDVDSEREDALQKWMECIEEEAGQMETDSYDESFESSAFGKFQHLHERRRLAYRMRVYLVALWKLFDARQNEWWAGVRDVRKASKLSCSYDWVYCNALVREVLDGSSVSYGPEDYQKSADKHSKVVEKMTRKIMQVMETIFSCLLEGLKSLKADAKEPAAVTEPSMDPKLLVETFLDLNDLCFGGKLCTTLGKPRRWCREEVVVLYNSKMAEVLCAWLDRFSPSAASEQLVAIAFEQISSYVKVVVAGGEEISKKDVELAVRVIRILRPHCAKEFLLLARDVIMTEHENLKLQQSSHFSETTGTILLALLSRSAECCGEDAASFLALKESILGDVSLTAFLELLAASGLECDDGLVGEAFELLEQRTLNCGLDMLSRVSTTSGSDHVTDDIQHLTKALLATDMSAEPCSKSLLLGGDSIPPCPNSTSPCASSIPVQSNSIPASPLVSPQSGSQFLSIMLASLEDKEWSSSPHVANGCRLAFVIEEELLLSVMRFCADQKTQSSVQLLLLLCRGSECGRRHFEGSFLHNFCLKISDELQSNSDTSLSMISQYLEHLLSGSQEEQEKRAESVGGALKVIQKLVLDSCVAVVVESSTSPSQLQEKAGSLLENLARLDCKALKKLKKSCKAWLTSEEVNRVQLHVASVVAMETKGDPSLCCLLVAKAISILQPMLKGACEERSTLESCLLRDISSSLSSMKTSGPIKMTDVMDSNKWNTFLESLLRSRFTANDALYFLSLVIPVVYASSPEGYTPLGMVYDMIWSHSEFFDVMCSSCDKDLKESLVRLLIAIVELDPSVCRTSHILVLLGGYSATRTRVDKGLLFLISKYEENDAPAGEYSPFLWGKAALESYSQRKKNFYWSPSDLGEALKLVDSQTLIKSFGAFPLHVELEPCNPFEELVAEERRQEEGLYDPCFLLPLLSHYLEEESHVDCRQFISHGCLGFLISGLSSLHSPMRAAAGHALTRFRGHLKESRFKEKTQIVLLLDVLQNSVVEGSPRLLSVFTSLAARASILFLHPENAVYPVVSRFVVHKPTFNMREVPLLSTMLYSSGSEGASEKAWLLRVLVGGLGCMEDYRFYSKHKVFSHVTSLAGSGMADKRAKELAKELLRRGLQVTSLKQ